MPIIGTLSDSDRGVQFSCGDQELDDYFRKLVLSNDRRDLGKAYVLRPTEDEAELPPILGFYTLSMNVVPANKVPGGLPRHLKTRLPRDVPVALIGRLAVESRVQGRDFGEILLNDALTKAMRAADVVGCYGVIADAKNQKAIMFMRSTAFLRLKVDDQFPKRMFLAMEIIKAAVR
jgi:hypothetical protein